MESTGRSKVFISYSRADLAFTDELATALAMSADFEILYDRVGISHGEDWRERLGRLIVECDTMVFVLSPDSVSSEICAWEIEEARRLSKRIIPVLWRAVDFARVPEGLSTINSVPFEGAHAVSGLPKLVAALKSDLAWLREHTRLGERAVDWENSGRAAAYLLRGDALKAAREWLAAKPSAAPVVTELQREFFQASEEEESRLLSDEHKRLEELEKAKSIAEAERDAAETARSNEANAARRVVRATTVGMIVALVLFVAASGAGWLAYQAAEISEKRRNEVLLNQSRFLVRAARVYLTRGDVANAIGLVRAALPTDLSNPDRPLAIEPVQVIFEAYGQLRERATLRGHTIDLKGAIALPDERILSWGRDGTIRWWHVDGELLKKVLAHEHPTKPDTSEDTGVHGVLHLEDGRLLSWGVDKTAKLWNDDGTFIAEFLNEESWIRIERLGDGRIAARIGNEYRVWSAKLEPLLKLRSPLKSMMGATLLSDGRFLTWYWESGKKAHSTAMLWSPDGTPGPMLEGHERMILDGFQLANGRIVTLENGPSIRIWSADGQLETVIEKAHKHAPRGPFAFPLRDGRFFTWGQETYGDNVWWARLWTAQGDSMPLIEASDQPLQGVELDDGRLLLGTNSRTPTIWHTNGTRGPVLLGHEQPAYGAEQWPDGRIATHGADHTARIWSRDGVPLLVLRGHEGGVSGVMPFSDKRLLTWSYSDRTVRVWGEEPRPRSLLRLEGGNAKKVQQLANGSIAVHTNTGSIDLYNPGLEPGPTLRNDARDIIGVMEISDKRLLTQGENYSIRQAGPALRMWTAAGKVIGDLAGPEVEFLHIAQTPSGRILGFTLSGQVWVWNSNGQLEDKRKGTKNEHFDRVVLLPDGRFVTQGNNGRLQLWSTEGEPGKLFSGIETRSPLQQISSFDDGRFLISFWNKVLGIWDENGEQRRLLNLEEGPSIRTATPLQDGKILLNRGDGSLIMVHSDGSFHEMQYAPGADKGYHKIFKLADGRLLVSTSRNNQGTRIWSADGKPGRKILDETISGARLLSDGTLLVWSDNSYDLQLIHPEGQPSPVLRGHKFNIQQALQLSDGRILSLAKDATVRIWPGSIDQAIAWADDVIDRLQPLTLVERCNHYLEPTAACAKNNKP